ncbi:MAG: hypothetical protein AAB948_02335, partial [Patescibacteria group bacterium]
MIRYVYIEISFYNIGISMSLITNFSTKMRGRPGRRRFGGGMPSRPSVEAPPLRPKTWRAEPSRKTSSSFLEEKIGRAQNQKAEDIFCEVAAGALAEAGGGAVQSVFRSKKVRAKDIISPHLDLRGILRFRFLRRSW